MRDYKKALVRILLKRENFKSKGAWEKLKKHSFTYEQYCTVLKKNIILEEITYHDGNRKTVCLNSHNCSENGECRDKYVTQRMKKSHLGDESNAD